MAWMHDCDNWVINSTRTNSELPTAVLLLWPTRRNISRTRTCYILSRVVRKLRPLFDADESAVGPVNAPPLFNGGRKNPPPPTAHPRHSGESLYSTLL